MLQKNDIIKMKIKDILKGVLKMKSITNLKKYYMEVVIIPHYSGFGMYQIGEFKGEKWEDKDDLLQEIRNNVDELYILGEDELPEEIEDIRGKIYGEPEIVYAWINRYNEVYYGGISEFEKEVANYEKR